MNFTNEDTFSIKMSFYPNESFWEDDVIKEKMVWNEFLHQNSIKNFKNLDELKEKINSINNLKSDKHKYNIWQDFYKILMIHFFKNNQIIKIYQNSFDKNIMRFTSTDVQLKYFNKIRSETFNFKFLKKCNIDFAFIIKSKEKINSSTLENFFLKHKNFCKLFYGEKCSFAGTPNTIIFFVSSQCNYLPGSKVLEIIYFSTILYLLSMEQEKISLDDIIKKLSYYNIYFEQKIKQLKKQEENNA
jgi:hypothetical protein